MDPALLEYRIDLILHGLFYLFLLVFTIHTVILGYHWFTYGRSRQVSMLALAVYLIGGAFLFLTMGAIFI